MKKSVCFVLIFVVFLTAFVGTTSLANGTKTLAIDDTAVTLPSNPFKDLPNGKWYTDAALWCYKYGYMSGTADETFSPNTVLSRAMFVQILFNAELAKEKYTEPSFTDVLPGKWYFNAVEWAYRNGYTSGTGHGKFSPNASVTREQLAVFLYNVAKRKNADVSEIADLTPYTDRGEVSRWARTALAWAVGQGFISGTGGGRLSPLSPASRSQAAVILSSFLKKYGIPWDNGRVITARTCTTDGVTEYRALDGSGRTMTVTLKAWHNYGYPVLTREVTCEVDGVWTYTCSVCKTTREEYVKAKGHKWNSGEVTKEPTCDKDGVRTFTCRVCQGTRREAIPAFGHKWDAGKVTRDPACTADGIKTYTCATCGSQRQEPIPALGHTTSNGICARCGAEVFPNISEKLRYYLKLNAERESDEYPGGLCIDCKNIVNNANYYCTVTVIPSMKNMIITEMRSRYYDTSSGKYAGTLKIKLNMQYVSTSYEYEVFWDEKGNGDYSAITSGWIKSANVSADPSVNTVTAFGRYNGKAEMKQFFLREMNEVLTDGLHAMEGKIFGTDKVGKITLSDLYFLNFK
ncbi:MAG: S-layer homology domain-containing protein [Clostridia bacterium]|nr:S-layer homology domain-containing protein [Clostridia bacterium]